MRIRAVTGDRRRSAGRAHEQHRRPGGAGHAQAPWGSRSASRSTIEKGIPLASGMGGSAASAVAAVVAANALIEEPVPRLQLLKFAMEGEIVASGSAHVDNIAPCLFGGLVLTVGIDHPRVKQIPVPSVGALRAGPSAHASRHPRGARGAQERRDALGFRVADGESRGVHQRLLLERSGHDSRFLQRCHHRAAAPDR